jgi:hypothetical protein
MPFLAEGLSAERGKAHWTNRLGGRRASRNSCTTVACRLASRETRGQIGFVGFSSARPLMAILMPSSRLACARAATCSAIRSWDAWLVSQEYVHCALA